MPATATNGRQRFTWRLLLKEVGAFGVVGVVCFLIDVVLFQVLYAAYDLGAVTAKLLATLASMSVAFIGHRYWSFSHRARTGLHREYVRFAAVNGAALLIGLAVVWLVRYPLQQESALVLQLANVGSIALGTIMRYVGYRKWVFPAPSAPGHEVAARST